MDVDSHFPKTDGLNGVKSILLDQKWFMVFRGTVLKEEMHLPLL